MSLKLEDIFSISRQIYIDFDYEVGLQPQTYGRVDVDPNLSSASFGYTYADFVRGEFHSRPWVNGGANPDEIKAAFPVIFAELLAPTPSGYGENSDRLTVGFLFIDKLSCEDPETGSTRSGTMVTTNLYRLGRAFMRELITYALYEVRREGEITTYEWLSEGRMEHLKGAGHLLNLIDRLEPYLVDEPDRFSRWGNYPDLRGLVTSVVFDFCAPENLSFRYDTPTVTQLANVNCPC